MAPSNPPKRPRKPASDLQRALRLLTRRELSRSELRARLGTTSPAPDGEHPQADALAESPADRHSEAVAAVERTLDRLRDLGLQSDARVAEVHLRARQARTGNRRLAAELRQRGLDGETIGTALAALAETELQRARALWERRFEFSRDPRERARQMRFLASRGFDGGVIRAVMGAAQTDESLPDGADLPDEG